MAMVGPAAGTHGHEHGLSPRPEALKLGDSRGARAPASAHALRPWCYKINRDPKAQRCVRHGAALLQPELKRRLYLCQAVNRPASGSDVLTKVRLCEGVRPFEFATACSKLCQDGRCNCALLAWLNEEYLLTKHHVVSGYI